MVDQIQCPICKGSNIGLVSNYYEAEKGYTYKEHHVDADGRSYGYDCVGMEQTALSKILTPPQDPFENSSNITLLVLFFTGVISLGLMIIFNLWGHFWRVFIPVFLVIVILFAWIAAMNHQAYQKDKPIWDELYYCPLDKIVFTPKDGRYYPLHQFHKFYSDDER